MMVTGLPFSLKSSPVDGMLVKSLSKDSETIQPVSFGEILKAKAKQLEQELNVSSAVVALAAMQTLSLPMPMLDLSANEEIYKVNIQPALEKGLPQPLTVQPSSSPVPSQIGEDQETIAGIQKVEAQMDTLVSGSTSAPSSAQLVVKTEMPTEVPEAVAKSLSISEATVSFDRDASIHLEGEVFSPSSNSKPDLNALKVSTQMPLSSDVVSIVSAVEQVTIPAEAKVEVGPFSPMAGVQQSKNETSKINNLPVDEAVPAAQPSMGTISGSITNDVSAVETQNVGAQHTPFAPAVHTQSPQPANRSVTAQTGIDKENVKTGGAEIIEPEEGTEATDEVQVHAPVAEKVEMPVSKNLVNNVRTEDETDLIPMRTVFNPEILGTPTVQTTSRSLPIQQEINQESTIVGVTNTGKQNEMSLPAAENTQPAVHNLESAVNSITDTQIRYEPKNSNRIQVETSATSSVSPEPNDVPGLAGMNSGNISIEAKISVAQDEKPVSLAENLQPDIEKSVVGDASSGINSTPEIEDIKVPASAHAEKISIPLDRPESESTLIQEESRQEKAGSGTEAVITEPNSNGTSNEVLRSESSRVSASREAARPPSVQPYQGFESQQNASFEKEIAVSRTSNQAGGDPQFRANMVFATDVDAPNQGWEASHQSVTPKKGSQTVVLQSESDVRDAQSNTKQTKTSSENNRVEIPSSVFASVENASPAKSTIPVTTFTRPSTDDGADDVTTQKGIQEISSAALKSESPKVALSQVETGLEKVLVDPQHTENQVDSNESVVETPQPLSDQFVILSSPVTDTENASTQTLSFGESGSWVTTGIEAPEAAPLQNGMDQERQIVDPEYVENQVSAKTTMFNVSKPGVDVPKVVTPSDADTHAETEFVRYKAAAQEISLKAGTDQARLTINPQKVEKLIDADEFIVEVAQSASDSHATGTLPSSFTDTQAKSVDPKPVAETTRPVRSDVQEAISFQAEITMEKPSVKPQIVEQELVANESEKVSQNVLDLPVASYDALTDEETPAVNIPTIAQATSSVGANVTLPDVGPSPVESGLEKPDVDPEINDPSAVSVRSNQELDARRTISEREARTLIEEATPSASTANKQEKPISVQPDAVTKVDSGKQQDLRADQPRSTDEKILPSEKQSESNEVFESASLTPNSARESMVIGSVEKGPTVQANPDAVEVARQVIHQLNGRLKSDATSMHLQLNPEQLGAIEVEMVRDSQGVSVTFFAEQATTGKLLESQLNQLRQSLVDTGIQLSGLHIGQDHHSGQQGGFLHQNTNFAQTFQRETHQREVNAKESPRAERATGQMSEVDYLV